MAGTTWAIGITCGLRVSFERRDQVCDSGERAGLEELKTEPLLEPPPPGSTELLRTEHVGRGCGLLVPIACVIADPASIKAFYTSPLSVDEVREWYVTTHGARYGLSRRGGSNLWDQTNPHRADEKRWASVMELRSTALRNPLSAYTEYPDLQPTPEGTQTFIILIYGFNELKQSGVAACRSGCSC